jgi:uncharacterized protein with PIN domain
MAPVVRGNIEHLGFQLRDVKILLSGHAHFDHVQGHAEMQRATGAQVMALGDDAIALETGRDRSPLGAEGWEPVHVDRVLRDGDAVTVYPFTPSLRASGVVRAGGDPPRPIRFVADIHLVKLAAWLRLAGFDTAVEADDERLAMMAGEDRVALTRDVGVLKRAAVRYGRWVHATDPERQFGEVIARYDLAAGMAPFTRCLRCNAALQPADAAAVADRLPPRVRATFREFSRCPACGRIYWRGTHYAKLAALLQRARTGM